MLMTKEGLRVRVRPSRNPFLRCGSPPIVPSGAASAGSIAVRPVNERGRMPPKGGRAKKSRQRSWAA